MLSQNIFDNPEFFECYKKLRENPENANITEEKPALFSLAPDLKGKSVLDLGCGYGENCAEFKRLGAANVTGIDISEKMLTVAKSKTAGIEYIHGDISDLSVLKGKYDAVFSSLAVHYIEDFNLLCEQISNLLNKSGCFIFSQEHPLTTAPICGANWTKDNDGNIIHYNLTDYNKNGKRETKWFVDGVIKYHRMFDIIVNTLVQNNFNIERIIETTLYEIHKPNFLLVKARIN